MLCTGHYEVFGGTLGGTLHVLGVWSVDELGAEIIKLIVLLCFLQALHIDHLHCIAQRLCVKCLGKLLMAIHNTTEMDTTKKQSVGCSLEFPSSTSPQLVVHSYQGCSEVFGGTLDSSQQYNNQVPCRNYKLGVPCCSLQALSIKPKILYRCLNIEVFGVLSIFLQALHLSWK